MAKKREPYKSYAQSQAEKYANSQFLNFDDYGEFLLSQSISDEEKTEIQKLTELIEQENQQQEQERKEQEEIIRRNDLSDRAEDLTDSQKAIVDNLISRDDNFESAENYIQTIEEFNKIDSQRSNYKERKEAEEWSSRYSFNPISYLNRQKQKLDDWWDELFTAKNEESDNWLTSQNLNGLTKEQTEKYYELIERKKEFEKPFAQGKLSELQKELEEVNSFYDDQRMTIITEKVDGRNGNLINVDEYPVPIDKIKDLVNLPEGINIEEYQDKVLNPSFFINSLPGKEKELRELKKEWSSRNEARYVAGRELKNKIEKLNDFINDEDSVLDGLNNDLLNFGTLGIASLSDKLTYYTIVKKQERGEELSPEQEKALKALNLSQQVDALDLSKNRFWYRLGESTQHSAIFIGQTIATAPVGGWGGMATKAVVTPLAKRLIGNTVAQLTKKQLLKVGAINFTERALIGTGNILTQAQVMPSTYDSAGRKYIGQTQLVTDENGNEKVLVTESARKGFEKNAKNVIKIAEQRIRELRDSDDPSKERKINELNEKINDKVNELNLIYDPETEDVIKDYSLLQSYGYGLTETLKELAAEKYVGTLSQKIGKKAGIVLDKTKIGRKVLNPIGNAINRVGRRGENFINQKFIDGTKFGRVSKNAIYHTGTNKLWHGLPSEVMEEIAVQLTPTYTEEYAEQFEELSKPMFYVDIIAQTLLMGGAFSSLGTSRHVYKYATDKQYRKRDKKFREQRKQIKTLFKNIDNSISDDQLAQYLLMNTAGTLFEVQDYQGKVAELRKEGKKEEADKLEEKSFLNIAINALKTNTLDTFERSIRRAARNQNLSEQTRNNAIKALKYIPELNKINNEYNRFLNKDELIGLSVNKIFYKETSKDIDNKIKEVEKEALQEIEEYKKANGITDQEFSLSNIYTKLKEDEDGKYTKFINELIAQKIESVNKLIDLYYTKDLYDQANYKNSEELREKTSEQYQEKIKEKFRKILENHLKKNTTSANVKKTKKRIKKQQGGVIKPELTASLNEKGVDSADQNNTDPDRKNPNKKVPTQEQLEDVNNNQNLILGLEDENQPQEEGKKGMTLSGATIVDDADLPEQDQKGMRAKIIEPETNEENTEKQEKSNPTFGGTKIVDPTELDDTSEQNTKEDTEEQDTEEQDTEENATVIEDEEPLFAPFIRKKDDEKQNNKINLFEKGIEEILEKHPSLSFDTLIVSLLNSHRANDIERHFYLLREAWEKASKQEVTNEEASEIYNSFFPKIQLDALLTKQVTEQPTTQEIQETDNSPTTKQQEYNPITNESEETEFVLKGDRRYNGTGLKLGGVLGKEYEENEIDGKFSITNIINESAKAFIDFRNFLIGEEVEFVFDIDYLLNENNLLTTWSNLDDEKPRKRFSSVKEKLEKIFEGQYTYEEIVNLLEQYKENKDPNNPLFQNEEFLKIVPVGVVNKGYVTDPVNGNPDIIPGGLNDYYWFNNSNVALRKDKNTGEPLYAERDQRVEANRQINLKARQVILNNKSFSATISNRQDKETNKRLLLTEEEKNQGYSNEFFSILSQFGDDIEEFEKNATIAYLDSMFNLVQSKKNNGENIIATIDGKEITSDKIVNFKEFINAVKRSEFTKGRTVFIHKSGIDSKGNTTYTIHNVINNHKSKQEEFERTARIVEKLFYEVINIKKDDTKDKKHRAEKIKKAFKEQFGIDLNRFTKDILADLYPEYVKSPKDGKRTGVLRQDYKAKAHSKGRMDVIPDLREFENFNEFVVNLLQGDVKTVNKKQLLLESLHTNLVFTPIEKNGETIYSTDSQPYMTFESPIQEEYLPPTRKQIVDENLERLDERQKYLEEQLEEAGDDVTKSEIKKEIEINKKEIKKNEVTKKTLESLPQEDTKQQNNVSSGGATIVDDDLNPEDVDSQEKSNEPSTRINIVSISPEDNNSSETEVDESYDAEIKYLEENKDEILGITKFEDSAREYLLAELDLNETEDKDLLDILYEKLKEEYDLLVKEIKEKEYEGSSNNSDRYKQDIIEELVARTVNKIFKDNISADVKYNEKDHNKASYEIDITKSLSNKVKLLLAGVKDQRLGRGFAGLYGNMSLPDAFDALHQILSETNNNSLEDIEEAINEKIKKNPKEFEFYRTILARLKEIEETNPEILKEILYNLYQPRINMKFVMWEMNNNGNIALQTYDANVKNPLFIKRSQWLQNIKLNGLLDLYEGQYYKVNDDNYEKAKKLYKLVKSQYYENRNINDVDRTSLERLLFLYGIKLNDQTLDNIFKEKSQNDIDILSILFRDKNGIIDIINKNLDIAKNSSKKLSFKEVKDKNKERKLDILTYDNSQLNDLIKADNFVEFIPMTSMYIGGLSINMYQQFNSIYNKIKQINASLKRGNKGILREFEESSITSNSILLEWLKSDPSLSKYFDTFLVSLEALKEGGTKSRDDMDITRLSDKDAFITLFGMFISSEGNVSNAEMEAKGIKLRKGLMSFPTISDSSQLPMLKTILMELSSDNVNTETDTIDENILEILREQLLVSDLKRIGNYINNIENSNIEGFDDGAIWITGMPSLNTVQVEIEDQNTGQIVKRPLIKVFRDAIKNSENIESDIASFVEKYKNEINSEINESITEEVDKLISKDLMKGQFKDFDLIDYGTQPPKLKLTDNTSKQYFKDKNPRLVAYDYIINYMLQQKEIQTLFAGDLAQYFKPKMSKDLKHGLPRVTEEDVLRYGDESLLQYLDDRISDDIDHEVAYQALLPVQEMKVNELFKKVQNNLSKRLKELLSPGNQFADVKNQKDYIQIMVSDVETASETIEDLVSRYYPDLYNDRDFISDLREFKKLDENYNKNQKQTDRHKELKKKLEKQIPNIAAYLETASTDAQEYTTWQDNLNQLNQQGRISDKEYRIIKNKLENQEKDLEDGDTIKEENRLTREEANMAMMQPSKPLYSGLHFEEINGQKVPRYVYIKSSSFPLIPELTEKFPKLNQVRKAMNKIGKESGGIVRLSYQSANKVGAVGNPISISELHKEDIDLDKVRKSSIKLNRENFYIQQDKPFKGDKNAKKGKRDENTRATQFEKIILGDGINKLGHVFPSHMFDKELLKELGIEDIEGMISGSDLKKIYNSIYEKEQKILADKLFDDLGISSYADIQQGKPVAMENLVRLLNRRLNNKQDRKSLELLYLDVNGIAHTKQEAIEKDIEIVKAVFKIPLFMTPNSKKFESVLNSIINNNSINLNLPGFSSPVASQEGFDFKGFDDNITYKTLGKKTQSKNVVIDNNNGRKPTNNDNEIVAYRGPNTKKLNNEQGLIMDLEENNMIGNPFGPYGLYKMSSSKEGEATMAFYNWLIGKEHTDLYQDYRQAILDKVDDIKGSTIVYYKELRRPSHATALDYFLNETKNKEYLKDLKRKGLITTKNFDPSKGLQSQRDSKTGKLKYAQVFLPNKFKVYNKETKQYEYINLQEFVDENGQIDTNKLPEDLLSMFSFRIPTSSHQSGVIIEIAGFLPHQLGDLMIVPKDHTVQIGEDYDIDTRYVYQYNYIKDENGNLKKLEYSDIEQPEKDISELREEFENYKKELFDSFYNETSDPKNPLEIKITLKNNYWRQNRDKLVEIAILQDKLDKYEVDKMVSALFPDDFEKELLTRQELKERILELENELIPSSVVKNKSKLLKEEYRAIKKELVEAFKNEKSEIYKKWNTYDNARRQKADEGKVLENNLIAMYKAVFSSPDEEVQQLVTKVLSTEFSETSASTIDDKLSDHSKRFSIYSPSTQRKVMELGADGKDGIGIHSNAVTLNSLLQQLDNQLQFIYYIDDETGEYYPYDIVLGNNTFDGKLGRIDDGKRRISEYLMESQNSATDNQKLEIMGRRNENLETIDVFSLLQMSGLEDDGLLINNQEVSYASLFISQPIIRDYVQALKKFKSSTNDEFGSAEKLAKKYIEEKYLDKVPQKYWEEDTIGYWNSKEKEKLARGLTSEKLYDQIQPLDSPESNLDFAAQYYIFETFLKLKKPASELRKLQQFVNIENGGLGISYFNTIDLKNKISEIRNLNITTVNKIGKTIRDDETGLFREMFGEFVEAEDISSYLDEGYIYIARDGNRSIMVKPNNHYSHKIMNSISQGYNLWNSLFPYDNKYISEQIESIIEEIGINPETNEAMELRYDIMSSMKDYSYSLNNNLFQGGVAKYQEELFFNSDDQESLGAYLQRLKNDPEYSYIFRKPFFKDLQIEINDDYYPTLIKFQSGDMSKINNIKMYNILESMVNSETVLPEKLNGKQMTESELMKELLMYSIIADQANGAIGFRHLLPLSLFEKYNVDKVLREKNNTAFPQRQNVTYNGLNMSIQSLLGSKPDQNGVIVNAKNVPIKQLKAIVDNLNNISKNDTFVILENGNVLNTEHNPSEQDQSVFIRQYFQHNPDKVRKVINYSVSKKSNYKKLLAENEIDDIDTSFSTKQFSNKYIVLKSKNGETLLFERYNEAITESDEVIYYYKRIPVLGTFGFNEYSVGKNINQSKVGKNNFEKKSTLVQPMNFEKVKEFINKNDLKTILNSMVNDPSLPYASLINILRDLIPDINNVEISTTTSISGKAVFKNNKILINEEFLNQPNTSKKELRDVIVEEFLHYVTTSTIGKYVTMTGINPDGKLIYKRVKDEDGNPKEIPSSLQTLLSVYNQGIKYYIKKHGLEKLLAKQNEYRRTTDTNSSLTVENGLDIDAYRTINIHEFLAGIFIKDSEFINEMANTQYLKSGSSILVRFAEKLAAFLQRILPNTRQDTISANAANALIEFLRTNNSKNNKRPSKKIQSKSPLAKTKSNDNITKAKKEIESEVKKIDDINYLKHNKEKDSEVNKGKRGYYPVKMRSNKLNEYSIVYAKNIKIPGFENNEFVIYKDKNNKYKIIEKTTGYTLDASEKTIKATIQLGQEILEKAGQEKLENRIKELPKLNC